ncbi:MAG: hypothetical protein WKF77_18845 [Planctomycetaceae bacterium]
MTALTLRFSTESDRVRGAARQVQSFLSGARDRAIYAKESRGVRFFISPENPRAVTTMAYIAPGGTWSSPENSAGVSLERNDGNGDGDFQDAADQVIRVHGKQNPGWWNLKKRGWLVDGLRIRIPKGPTGNWYPIDTSLIDITIAPTEDQFLLLQIPYADGGDNGQQIAHGELSYEIELPAKLLPQDPSILPESVVIDLDGSRIPVGWQLSPLAGSQYSGYMDIVFSTRGNIVGGSAGAGVIHLYICDSEDSLFLKERYESAWIANGNGPLPPPYRAGQPFVPMDEIPNTMWVGGDQNYKPKDRRILTIFTQTGAVSGHLVNSYLNDGTLLTGDSADPFDINNDGNFNEADGLADDPYYFAEIGKVAK